MLLAGEYLCESWKDAEEGWQKNFQKYFSCEEMIWGYLYCWKEIVFSYLSSFSPVSETLLSRTIDSFCSGGICLWIFMIKPPWMIGLCLSPGKRELMAHLFVIQENKGIASIWGKW